MGNNLDITAIAIFILADYPQLIISWGKSLGICSVFMTAMEMVDIIVFYGAA
jgi:hypothetical protein